MVQITIIIFELVGGIYIYIHFHSNYYRAAKLYCTRGVHLANVVFNLHAYGARMGDHINLFILPI